MPKSVPHRTTVEATEKSFHSLLSLGNALNIKIEYSSAGILRTFTMLKSGGGGVDIQVFPNLFDYGTLLRLICWDPCSVEHTLRKVTLHS